MGAASQGYATSADLTTEPLDRLIYAVPARVFTHSGQYHLRKSMSDTLPPTLSHFSSTGCELPVQYYTEIGRALCRWSQLEATVAGVPSSVLQPF
jgi:hypothetical protein